MPWNVTDFIVMGILVVVSMLPWCFWPKRGTRSRAALTGYRRGFTPLATLPLGLMLWMVGRILFVDIGDGWSELFGLLFGMIGWGVSVVVGIIAAIVRGVRWKHPLKCERCGYPLVGLTSDKCPECGHTVSTTATA